MLIAKVIDFYKNAVKISGCQFRFRAIKNPTMKKTITATILTILICFHFSGCKNNRTAIDSKTLEEIEAKLSRNLNNSEKKPNIKLDRMFFQSPKTEMWDTWLYYEKGKFHLFWLDGPIPDWDSHVKATSDNGVDWYYRGSIHQKPDSLQWTGTGHTWKAPDFENNHLYITNYSECKIGRTNQSIQFLVSKDLEKWVKVDEKFRFKADTRWYVEDGRWDCIDVVKRDSGGYYGYWTATPNPAIIPGALVGFGKSENGLVWESLKPPVVHLDRNAVEVGGIHKLKDKYYLLLSEGIVCVGNSPFGPFEPQKINTNMFGGKMYFPRFFHNHPDGLMVNYHMTGGVVNMAPLKLVEVGDDGIMRAVWWKGNEQLKDKSISINFEKEARNSIQYIKETFSTNAGTIVEGVVDASEENSNSKIYLEDISGNVYQIEFKGSEVIYTFKEKGKNETKEIAVNDRGIKFGNKTQFRILLKDDCIESYCNNYLMTINRIPKWNGKIGVPSTNATLNSIKIYQTQKK